MFNPRSCNIMKTLSLNLGDKYEVLFIKVSLDVI